MAKKSKRLKDFTFGDLYDLLYDWIPVRRLPKGSNPYGGDVSQEVIAWYAIGDNDAEFLTEMTTLPVWHDPETDLYFFGQYFWGTSPWGEKCDVELTEAGVEYLKEIGYTED